MRPPPPAWSAGGLPLARSSRPRRSRPGPLASGRGCPSPARSLRNAYPDHPFLPGWPSPSASARGLGFTQYAGLTPYRTGRWNSRRLTGRTRSSCNAPRFCRNASVAWKRRGEKITPRGCSGLTTSPRTTRTDAAPAKLARALRSKAVTTQRPSVDSKTLIPDSPSSVTELPFMGPTGHSRQPDECPLPNKTAVCFIHPFTQARQAAIKVSHPSSDMRWTNMVIQACNPKHGSRTSRPDPRSGLLDPIRSPLRGSAARDREGPVPCGPDNPAAWNHRPFFPWSPPASLACWYSVDTNRAL